MRRNRFFGIDGDAYVEGLSRCGDRDRLFHDLCLVTLAGAVIADRIGETPCVFLAGLYRAERTIAHRLMRLANGPLPWPWIDPDKALPWVEKHVGFTLAESQVAAGSR